MILWILGQLPSYSILCWCEFASVAAGAAYFGRIPGVVSGHVVVAALVVIFDVRWIQSVLDAPGWTGTPDMDFVFFAGALVRIVLINTTLLPVSILALWLVKRSGRELVPS